ncbi:hypothetical protein BT96DRAFT_941366 [Gymnopus androsaceus JB14]|uniref:Uncharacterized protein n=1 Tax=Gymnopus androsaceus JB14 TaxID=1447944 RepID=A0A6A4HGH7_9AGAR|nr:hypothetical protein BT96DRAFT_941366 [Gymnopus androsaceus JB14]
MCSESWMLYQASGKSLEEYAGIGRNMQEFGTVSNPLSKRTGRPRAADDGDVLYITEIIKTCPTIYYLDELQYKLETVRGVELSITMLSQTMRRIGLSNKRVQRAASERDEELEGLYTQICQEKASERP